MVKDRKARWHGRITLLAIANLISSIVATMRDVGLPNDAIMRFLDNLDHRNSFTLEGLPLHVMDEIIEIIRSSVPSND